MEVDAPANNSLMNQKAPFAEVHGEGLSHGLLWMGRPNGCIADNLQNLGPPHHPFIPFPK